MHHSLLQFFIEATFNLTLVGEPAWALSESWKNSILELITSLPAWSSMLLSHLSFQPFVTSQTQTVEAIEATKMQCQASEKSTAPLPSPTLSKRPSSIVRGRDLPFPAAPPSRRRTLQTNPSNLDINSLFQQRYSSISLPAPVDVDVDDVPSRGRTLRCTQPRLSRSDAATATSPKSTSEELHPIRRMSRNKILLRVPPFPLPHRPLQCSVSQSPARKDDSARRISKRVSSIPPPLLLDMDIEDEGLLVL